MHPQSSTAHEPPVDSREIVVSTTRLMYWSMRRELWENRSIYIAPLVVAGVVLFGFLINTLRLPRTMRELSSLDREGQRIAFSVPYNLAASVILLTGLIVGAFYCLDALYGERRDRSILFWKSLPVSDVTTVLSKASMPIVIQPVIGLLIAHATQLVMLLMSTVVLLANGMSPMTLWTRLPLFQMPLVMCYGVAVHALWYAPIYAWLLMISAWARRSTFLWATLPIFAIYVVERIAFGKSYFVAMLKYRIVGAMTEAFSVNAGRFPITRLSQLEPLGFLSSSGLLLGLAFAAVFLTAAVRLRRKREPI